MRRTLIAGLAGLATLAVTASPAQAVWLNTHTATSISLLGNGDDDVIALTCDSGPGTVLVAATPFMPCADLVTINVKSGAGQDIVDLSGVDPQEFTALTTVTLNSFDGEFDNYLGSQLADVVHADGHDLVTGNGGDDVIFDAGDVYAGPGDDTVEAPLHKADLGPGNDRVLDPVTGPVDGGPGADRLTLDYGSQAAPHTFAVTPTSYTHSYGGVALTVQVQDVETFELRFSAGDDTVDVRNGRVDSVHCAGGTDRVVADRDDVLTDCETADRGVPDTAISGPSKVKRGTKAHFAITSDHPGATYLCALDGRAAVPCPAAYVLRTRKLRVGTHSLVVTSVLEGNTDPSPATHPFRITRASKKGHHR